MRFQIVIDGESEDRETIMDFIDAVENFAPYMFDNVIVRESDETTTDGPLVQEARNH